VISRLPSTASASSISSEFCSIKPSLSASRNVREQPDGINGLTREPRDFTKLVRDGVIGHRIRPAATGLAGASSRCRWRTGVRR
jgi:hypothetical protein